MVNLKISVTGKVQGVWFRAKTKEKAGELGVFGFVQNKENGSVYIEVSGKSEDVYRLVEWLQTGSPLSKVKEVCLEKNSKSYTGEFIINR